MEILNLFRHKHPEVIIVYAEKYKDSGSTIMRGEQLYNIVSSYCDLKISYLPQSQKYKDCILYLTKGALLSCDINDLALLASRNNKIILDPVDLILPDGYSDFAHFIIAASRTAYREYKEMFPRINIGLIDHHADPRISQTNDCRGFRIAYFGEPQNAVLTKEIKEIVDVIPVDTTNRSDSWIKEVSSYSAHYALRNQQEFDGFKPFTKGFNAAYCGANILVNKTYESVYWLTEDYPFFFDSKANEDMALMAIEKMKKSFGSKEWSFGVSIMKDLRERVSPKIIAKQFEKIIDSLS